MSELYLVRHGQASLGSANYDQLTELGTRQSQVLGAHLARRGLEFDLLYTGTMQRHRQTLAGIGDFLDIASVDRAEHAGLNEYDFESLTRNFAKSHADDPLVLASRENPRDSKAHYRLLRQALLAWSRDELDHVAETHAQFVARIAALASDLQRQAGRATRVLAISSGGAISRFVGSLLALQPEKVFELNLQARNTGVSQFFFNEHKYNLLQFNGIAHLEHPDHHDLMSF